MKRGMHLGLNASLIEKILKELRNIFNKWIALIRKIEGPELEPFLWHSHYLSTRYSNIALTGLGRKLEGKILDVGAGTGYGVRFLDGTKTTYIPTDLLGGRDPSDSTISKRAEKIGIYCSANELPFLDGCIDGIMMISVLEHLKNPHRSLKEAYRLLAPGGNVLVATPFAFPVHGYPLDFHRWTREGLRSEIESAGFVVLEEDCFGNIFSSLALNVNLFLKYGILQHRNKLFRVTYLMVSPLRFIYQVIFNLFAILLGPIDKSNGFPLGIAMIGGKR